MDSIKMEMLYVRFDAHNLELFVLCWCFDKIKLPHVSGIIIHAHYVKGIFSTI